MKTDLHLCISSSPTSGLPMLFPALFALTAFAVSWLVFAIIAYTVLYTVFTITYFCVWTEEERRAICPKGFWHAVLVGD